MVAPLVALAPIVTAVGRFAVPYLAKELGKIGSNKFVQTYGNEAFTSLNETLIKNTTMVNSEAMPMVNPSFKAPGVIAPDAEEMEREAEKIREMTKPIGFPAEPPIKPDIKTGETTPPKIDTVEEFPAEEEKLPNIEGFPSDTQKLPIIFEQRDVKKQTEQALEPKVEFGSLTETEKQTAKALMGDKPEFYSRAVDAIKNAKQNKFTKGKWKSIVQSNSTKEEMDYLGLSEYLQGNESISKQDLLDFVEQKNIADKLSVVEVPLEDQYDFSQFSIGGAGGKRAVSNLPYDYAVNPTGQKLQEGYKSTVEQYVFQVDGPEQWSADPAHFSKEYAKNAIAHARAQTGYFNADAVEKRLNAKEADGVTLTSEDKILKNASRQLEDTFIVDEIQSDMIQQIQKKGIIEDYDIIKNEDLENYFKKNNMEYSIEYDPSVQMDILRFPISGQVAGRPGVVRGLPLKGEQLYPRYEIFKKDNNFHVESILPETYEYSGKQNLTNDEAVKKYLIKTGEYGVPGLPITESKKYVELVLNAMIKKAVEKDLDSIGITNGQIQYDRYEGQSEEDKEGLKKFYDEIVFKQLEKIADKYNVELETVELPGKTGPKNFDDVGLNEPTEQSDSLNITRRTQTALRDGFVLRKVNYSTLANTIESINRGTVEGDPLPDNATLPDYASIFTETGRGAGDNILDTLIDDNPDIENEKDYYMWIKPDSEIDKAITKANAGELMSLARVWNNRDINLQMPISSVVPSGGTDINSYNSFISEYFDEKGPDLKYMHEIIKMKLPKKLQKDILSKPIKLSKAKTQTDRLFA